MLEIGLVNTTFVRFPFSIRKNFCEVQFYQSTFSICTRSSLKAESIMSRAVGDLPLAGKIVVVTGGGSGMFFRVSNFISECRGSPFSIRKQQTHLPTVHVFRHRTRFCKAFHRPRCSRCYHRRSQAHTRCISACCCAQGKGQNAPGYVRPV